LNNEVYPGKYT